MVVATYAPAERISHRLCARLGGTGRIEWKSILSENSRKEITVNDATNSTDSLSLKFPNPAREGYLRAQEFQRLSPEDRWKQIAELIEIGMNMVHSSPRRAEIERRMDAQEAEWSRRQQEVFSKYGE
jgi:hypothetical protein